MVPVACSFPSEIWSFSSRRFLRTSLLDSLLFSPRTYSTVRTSTQGPTGTSSSVEFRRHEDCENECDNISCTDYTNADGSTICLPSGTSKVVVSVVASLLTAVAAAAF